MLAVFWVNHHKAFHLIRKTDRIHTWTNILYLMFVALITFSTSLIGHYTYDWVDELFFSLNIFAIGSLFLANWLYASRRHRLIDSDVPPSLADMLTKRSVVVPLVALLAASLSIIKPVIAP